jgi:Lon protease-like protein
MGRPMDLPIFPLNTVLFPGGLLPLKIFEQRYMEMAKDCLKRDAPFGVCLIADGAEVGAPASPHAVGSTARITDWDMPDLGVLHVTVRGEQRFRILHHAADGSGLIRASVESIEQESACPVPASLQALLPLLRAMVAEVGSQRIPVPHAFDDAVWVGYRYCEMLPIPLAARQKLLELNDTLSRLQIILQFLSQRGLVS